ncbi:ABC-2 family transporter protein [Catellatospora sp. KI3]|uniref:ABC transporter permease n=1 Tax=Catellatospora sp. KI3 TaxID=3041620 RepID=UPI0024826A40|nr:ABC-2 family transporter protein [Catellatospora sp. KI3]MDI1459692.1 ABC-2 family transporter protein [Catellatospora sp. KI3]
MRPYLSLWRMSTRRIMTYRMNSLLSWLGGGLFLASSLAVWHALLADGEIGGYDWPHMKTYLLVGWASAAIGSAYGDWWMAERIQTGQVAIDLTKPIDYQWARFSEHMGGLALEFGAIAVAGTGMVVLTGGIPVPTAEQALLFAASFAMVPPLKFTIAYFTTMTCFWTQNFMGVSWAKDALVTLFSGALIPLALLPGWLGGLASALPFASLTATPAALLLGQADGLAALRLLAVQAAWVLALWWAARLVWRRALRALTVHGG